MNAPLLSHTSPRGIAGVRQAVESKTTLPGRHLALLAVLAGLLTAGCRAGDSGRSEPAQASIPVYLAEPTPPTATPAQTPPEFAAEAATDWAPPPPPPQLSQSTEDLVHLVQAHIGEDVLQAYIEGVNSPFDLDADRIVYLTDLGVAPETIAAMVRRDQILRGLSSIQQLEPTQPSEDTAAAPSQSESVPPTEPETPGIVASAVPADGVAPLTVPANAAPPPAPAQVSNNYFYTTLAPYGSWIEIPDYGWCWQPSVAVVESDWQPYSNGGRWIWSDYGWYWQSYYSWGWAPFHYGRWHLSSNCGWVWMPDTTWGPAWVTWRYYDGYCGWAPLPPACRYTSGLGFTYYGSRVGFSFGFGLGSHCYSFVPTSCFYTARPWTYRVAHHEVNKFYGNTTIINNYVHGNNNTIINRGIGTETIASASRAEIRKVRVSDSASLGTGAAVRADRLSRDGSTLAAYRPKLPAQSSRPPQTVSQRQEQRRAQSNALVQSEAVRASRANASTLGSRRMDNPRQETPIPPLRTQSPASGSTRLAGMPPAETSAGSAQSVTLPPNRSPRSEPRVTRFQSTPSLTPSATRITPPTRDASAAPTRTEQRLWSTQSSPATTAPPTRTRPVISIPGADSSRRDAFTSRSEVRRSERSLTTPPARSSSLTAPLPNTTRNTIPSSQSVTTRSQTSRPAVQPPQRSTQIAPTRSQPTYRPSVSRPSLSRPTTRTESAAPRPSFSPPPRSNSRPAIQPAPTRSSPPVSRSAAPPTRSAPSRSSGGGRSR